MEYQEKIHGPILLEYVDKPSDGWTYRLTKYGCVFRKKDGSEEWVKYYDVMVHAVAAHVALVRNAPFQKILEDNYDGPVPEQPTVKSSEVYGRTYRTKKGKVLKDKNIEELAKEAEEGYDVSKIKDAPRRLKPIVAETIHVGELPPLPEKKEGRQRVAETKETPKKEPAAKKESAPKVDKPQRLGARAKKLLEMDLGLTRPEQEEVRTKADAISRARVLKSGKRDGLTRVWDIYEAAGKELPKSLAEEREDFMQTGVLKRSRSGNGNGAPKEKVGGKSAASTTQSQKTSNGQQTKPDPKPGSVGAKPDDSGEAVEETTDERQKSGSSTRETETL